MYVRTEAAQVSATDGWSPSLAAPRPAALAVEALASDTFAVSACSAEAPTALSPEAPTALSSEGHSENRLLYQGLPGFSAGAHSS